MYVMFSKSFGFPGVLDDRGKFIFISTEELQKVADFVRKRGRVSLRELADSSGSLISLQAEAEESKQIAQEA